MLKLTVDLGKEQRTILSGIGEKMEDLQQLVGKHVAVVANLKPAMLMGLESQGMLLSADTDEAPELPHFYRAKPGAEIR